MKGRETKKMKTNDKNSKKRAAPPRYDEAFRAVAVRKLSLGKAFHP